jgi:hypothetical protein
MAVRTAGRRRPSRKSGDVAHKRRRAPGHLRRHNRSRNSLGSHRNRSARPPRRPNLRRHRRAPSRSGWRRRRRRIGSPRLRTDSGYPLARRAATGCRLPLRLSRLARTVPQLNMSAEGAHPIRRPAQRLSQQCSLRPAPEAATRWHLMPSIRDARLRRPRWPPNRVAHRHTPSPSRPRSGRRGDTAVRRTPVGSRLPTCWRGSRPPRREAGVADAARSEIGCRRPSGTRNAGPERTNF